MRSLPGSRSAVPAILVAVALLVSACSGSVEFSFGGQTPAEAAIELIEGDEMALRLGIDDLTGAVCDDPPDREIGTVFNCTATSGGKTVEFDVELEAEDRIFAGPTNVVDRTVLGNYATSAVRSLNSANGFELPDDAIDCGTQTVVLDSDRQMICTLTDPDNGDLYDAVLTVRDTEQGTFAVEIVERAS